MRLTAIGGRLDAATLARLARRTPEPVLRAMSVGPMRSVFFAAQLQGMFEIPA